ncbi:MAG: HEPN domain-containing protein [Bacteroidales bacterium]|jgi:hypothetical protein|nr:HEPN domain-containing protein [Bacteroidales bacterium]
MNSQLQNKSDINLDSAKLLHDKAYYPSVAHCSYYACYQQIKHIWLHTLNKSETDLDSLCKQNSREGSHEVLINHIVKFIKNSSNPNNTADSRVINNEMLQLKKMRIKSDYKDEIFDSTDSSKSLALTDKIIPVLKKYQ